MSISQLVEYIGQDNIAENLDDDTLVKLGQQVKRQYDEDKESMRDWEETVEEGIKLMKQEWKPKSTPWEGASNYKDPIMIEASVKFGDRASLELLRSRDLVATSIIGRDPDGAKKAAGDRVSETMNYQINYDMHDWRDDQERLFYSLPNYGTVFKKLVKDPISNATESVPICYPDFAVNQATKSMDSARSFTHVLDFSKNEVEERINAGIWLDFREENDDENNPPPGDKGSNEAEGTTHADENPDNFLEQQCFFDLDDDGYEEPYIVTIHHKSCKVVRVMARYDEQSIFVRYSKQNMSLMEARNRAFEQSVAEFGGMGLMRFLGVSEPDVNDDAFDLLKIDPFQNVAKYGFIPAPDGTFLNLGYMHLLGAMTMAINSTTNQLNDAGTLDNLSGGFLAKEFRKELGLQRLKPGEWKKTNVPAEKLAKGVFPKPAQQPSQTLYQLGKDKLDRAMGYLSVIDISGQIQPNTAPTTALAIINEAAIPTNALFNRILRAESQEFRILFRLNRYALSPEKYQQLLMDDQASPERDFDSDALIVVPTASAEMSSKTNRIQMAGIELEQFDRVLQAGGNPIPIVKNFFEAIGSSLSERVFPEEGTMTPQEKEQLAQLTKQQELQNQIAQQQLEILSREQDRLDYKTNAEVEKIRKAIEEMSVGMLETLARAAKYAEEAESEDLKNRVDTYTQDFKILKEAVEALGVSNDRTPGINALIAAPANNA